MFFLCIVLTCVHAASPTYDDNPPPSYIWGSGGLNPQTSGTPNKSGESNIIDAVNVQGASITAAINNQNVNVGSISVDTSAIESYLRVGDGETATSTITELINGIGTDTKNINSALNVDNVSVTELVNGIGTDTKTIKNNTSTIAELIASVSSNIGNIIINSGAWTSQDVSDLMDNVTNIPDGTGATTSLGNMLNNINWNIRESSQNPSLFRTQRLSNIAPSTAVQLNYIADPEIDVGNETTDYEIRKFIELRAIDPTAEFFIGFDNTVSDSTGRPVVGRILLNMDTNTDLYIYHTNNSAISIQQTEGWIVK